MTNPNFIQLIGGIDANGKTRAIAVDESGNFYNSTPPVSTGDGSIVVVDGIGNKTDAPAELNQEVASLVSLLKSVVNSTILSGDIAESATIADCLNVILSNSNLIADRVSLNTNKITELSNIVEEVRTILVSQENAISQIKTTPIQTTGSGNKIIIPKKDTQQIRIHSLNFIASDTTTIQFKFGNNYIASGSMNLFSFSSDYTYPMVVPIDNDFIINVAEEVTLNGYVIWD
jgi:hypothetical protein